MRLALVGDGEWTTNAMIFIRTILLILGSPEQRQDIRIGPAGVPQLCPVVIVLLLTSDIDEAVYRARAPQHLAARLEDLASIEVRLGFGLEHPVVSAVGEKLCVADRDMNPGIEIAPSGFDQQHAVAARGTETVGQYASGRSCAYDDVIILSEIMEFFVLCQHAVARLPAILYGSIHGFAAVSILFSVTAG
jgi:hypothetical protein